MVVAKQGELLSMILFDLHIHTTLSASRLRRNILQCSSLHTPHLDCGRVRVGAQRRLRHDQGGAVVETDTFSFRNHDQQPLGRGRLSPTVPPTEEELDYGAPLLLGSRGDDVTPKVPYQFTPREPLFKFERGWSRSNQNSAAALPFTWAVTRVVPSGVSLRHSLDRRLGSRT